MAVSELRAVIAGGGTGGHLFPGIAVARELEKRAEKPEILFVVGKRPLEAEILSRYGYPSRSLDVEGLKGGSIIKKMKVIFGLPGSLSQASDVIRRLKPHFVLGVGGYSSGPVCLAARMMKVPSAVHEQNSYPGLTNRLLARVVDCCFVSFEESARFLKCPRIVITGNPVREEFLEGSGRPDSLTIENQKDMNQSFTLLVVGGSQGAIAVNEAVIEAVKILKGKGRIIRVIHQTGKNDLERISSSYKGFNADAEVSAFIYDMAAAYRKADLVVGRAGATTIFELAATGKPSILVPYPFAANNHQESNARSLVKAGAAEMILQRDLSGELLCDLIMKYMTGRDLLSSMSRAALGIARPYAAGAIADGLMEMAHL